MDRGGVIPSAFAYGAAIVMIRMLPESKSFGLAIRKNGGFGAMVGYLQLNCLSNHSYARASSGELYSLTAQLPPASLHGWKV